MTFSELLAAVDQLNEDELTQLKQHIESREQHAKAMDIDAIEQIFAQMREGFSETDLDELEWAMNVEYIEPVDDEA